MREPIITVGEYVQYCQPVTALKLEWVKLHTGPRKPSKIINLPSSFKFWKRLMETPYYLEKREG